MDHEFKLSFTEATRLLSILQFQMRVHHRDDMCNWHPDDPHRLYNLIEKQLNGVSVEDVRAALKSYNEEQEKERIRQRLLAKQEKVRENVAKRNTPKPWWRIW